MLKNIFFYINYFKLYKIYIPKKYFSFYYTTSLFIFIISILWKKSIFYNIQHKIIMSLYFLIFQFQSATIQNTTIYDFAQMFSYIMIFKWAHIFTCICFKIYYIIFFLYNIFHKFSIIILIILKEYIRIKYKVAEENIWPFKF